MALLEVEAVSVEFGGRDAAGAPRRALDSVTLALPDSPSIVAVVGESGSGKTTLTRVLLGLLAPTAGTARYRGDDLARLAGTGFATYRREVQAVFQDPFGAYNPFYKVDRTLALPARRFAVADSPGAIAARIEACLETVGLRPGDTLGRYPHQLSGGQRQRLMIARALMLEPRVIVADEPVSMVDASLRATILETLYGLHRTRGISILYVTHDLATAYQIADRVVVMYRGRIVEDGPAEAVIRQPSHAYTRALVAAIPPPDPDTPWDLEADPGLTEYAA